MEGVPNHLLHVYKKSVYGDLTISKIKSIIDERGYENCLNDYGLFFSWKDIEEIRKIKEEVCRETGVDSTQTMNSKANNASEPNRTVDEGQSPTNKIQKDKKSKTNTQKTTKKGKINDQKDT